MSQLELKSGVTHAEQAHEVHEKPNYLNHDHSVMSWLYTLDHKRIGILYLVSITAMFILGGIMAALVRVELSTPKGDFLTADTYNKSFTAHGVIMLFFFLIPSIPAVMGNFALPLMIGARDVAFPRLNLLSYYLYALGAGIGMVALLYGGVDTGWTFYTPYSSTYSNSYVTVMAVGLFCIGFSSILTGLNFVVTVHRMRCPGLTWFRLPLFIWAIYATSVVQLLGTPVIAITLALLGVERTLGVGIFDPRLGGDPVLFQHMFWFYSHPAVYIMILPSLGLISEVIATFSRKNVFGYKIIALSSVTIAVFGFIVWAHHMFTTGISPYAAMVFSFLTFSVAIPSGIKVFTWLATMYKGAISFETPMIYGIAFIGLFTIGGVTGLYLSTLGMDIHLHDTYFVVAHFHYIMVGGAILGFMAGLHFWWPKITGRMYSDFWGKLGAGIIFIGFNFTFFPQFILGYLGMPRRYHEYPEELQLLNVMSSAGATILAIGYTLPLIYLTHSFFWGEKAGKNPWGATTLDWTATDSPPSPHNFDQIPVVTEEPYHFERKEAGVVSH
ncbi:MAG: cytochrome c oxidase subunit I [Gemmataceae bacterium]|nr:cytochrome c oxidase subunit I [Gemmataceae bacterium]